MITLHTAVAALIANKRRVNALAQLGIVSVEDLLTYYPFRVAPPVPWGTLAEARSMALGAGQAGEQAVFKAAMKTAAQSSNDEAVAASSERSSSSIALAASIIEARVVRGSGWRFELQLIDEQGSRASAVFFSRRKQYVDWLASRMHTGARVVLAGTPSLYRDRVQFTHPEVYVCQAAPEQGSALPMQGQEQRRQPSQTQQYHHMQPQEQNALQRHAWNELAEQELRRYRAQVTRPKPVYHATARISSEHIHETILYALKALGVLHESDVFAAAGQGLTATAPHAVMPTDISNMPRDMSQNTTFNTSLDALSDTALAAVPDIIPESVRLEHHFPHRAQALLWMHQPPTLARYREACEALRFEEALVSQVAVLQSRAAARTLSAYQCADDALVRAFTRKLPFNLTGGQRSVIEQIQHDMSAAKPMQRLLQGEVGAGKTLVALAAMLQAVGSGYQAVLIAPTQVLAEQHALTISEAVKGLQLDGEPLTVLLITGGMRLAQRRRALAAAASGAPCIIVATHAAFSQSFQAPRLALVVIDEQHRFGVEQRAALRARGTMAPHILAMTATPIPRTVAMTWFGDLDVSELMELPGGRKPISTFIIPEGNAKLMSRMFWLLRERVNAGERAYVVCSRIASSADADIDIDMHDRGMPNNAKASNSTAASRLSNTVDAEDAADTALGGAATLDAEPRALHAVYDMAQRLQSLPQLSGVRIATLTGRDDDATKLRVMREFSEGAAPVLVATTVIEVGVDVPEASCMVIFDADRYGLAQLHQLRGRVGRGGTKSWAFLVAPDQAGDEAAQRLAVVAGTLDGSVIASEDLRLRGAGNVLGEQQAGHRSGFKLLRVVDDAEVIAQARAAAERLLATDAQLQADPQLAGAVLDFTRSGESAMMKS